MRSWILIVVGVLIISVGFYMVVQKEFGPSVAAEQTAYCERLLHDAYSGDAAQIANARSLCDSDAGIRAAEKLAGVSVSAVAEEEQPTRRRRVPFSDWIKYVLIGVGAGCIGLGGRGLRERRGAAPSA